MLISCVLCLAVAGCRDVAPLGRGMPPSAVAPQVGPEEFLKQFLKQYRDDIALLESLIEDQEQWLKDFDFFTPAQVADTRKSIARGRTELEKRKTFERELTRWEGERKRKPGLETDLAAIEQITKLHKELWPARAVAPMPREVKPRSAGAKP